MAKVVDPSSLPDADVRDYAAIDDLEIVPIQ
jgi:hypothetical protein